MELKKNDVIKLNITSMTAQGSGVGKTDGGIVVFVPLSAVGDELEVKVLKTKKTNLPVSLSPIFQLNHFMPVLPGSLL